MARRKSFKPEWDRGNGWKTTRDEWQDFDKAEEVTISIDQLADFKCPASGSTITITCDHIQPGLAFGLHVGPRVPAQHPALRQQIHVPQARSTCGRSTARQQARSRNPHTVHN